MQNIRLQGSMMVDEGRLPPGLVQTLSQRVDAALPNDSTPTGYPRVFALRDAIPELSAELGYRNVIVTSSRAVWQVEVGTVQISVDMLCQPQTLEGI
jgi:hypothetical protein